MYLINAEPGTITFEERGILVKESVGVAQIPVLRKSGSDGEVSIRWRTIGFNFNSNLLFSIYSNSFILKTDKKALSGRDFEGGEGVLEFRNAEVQLIGKMTFKFNRI